MASEEEIKRSVIDIARQQAKDGAHYLWGGAGNRPGKADGATYRPSHVQLLANVPDLSSAALAKPKGGNPVVPALFAAYVDSSDQGTLVCAGRCALDAVQKNDLALKITVKEALALKLKAITDPQFGEFKKNGANVSGFRWPRPNGGIGRSDYPCTIWGESCIGVRHFDCIGLVNYCYSIATNNPKFQYGIDSFVVPTYARAAGFLEVKPISGAKIGDIVTIGREHIGIVTEAKTAVEAMDPGHGVVERALTAGAWTQCWRITGSGLK